MNKIVLIFSVVIISFNFSFSQTKFEIGFKAGYSKGYCYEVFGCIEPITPITPVLKIGENINNYEDGYNRGFTMGLDKKNKNQQEKNKNNEDPIIQQIDYTYKESEISPLRVQAFNKLMPRAINHFKNDEFEECIKICDSLIKIKMGTEEVYMLAGSSYYNLKDNRNAIKYLRVAAQKGNKEAKEVLNEIDK